jgi:peptidoglycan/xylan/chitin deacetylase (PgdA/CDA1 family)
MLSEGTPGTLVLCYHAVSPTFPAPLSVTPEDLERQLVLLLRRGYVGATFSGALEDPDARRTLVVTFDDAYRSVLELGLPILERLGVPGTVFAPTDHIGSDRPISWAGIDQWLGGAHEHELVPMSWAELGGLADRGWEVGSHTCSHPRLTQTDDALLAAELRQSKERCEEALGGECTSLAYPYGDHDARVVAATGAAGYQFAATLPTRLDAAGRLEVPRVGVYHRDGMQRFRLKVSPVLRALRSSPAWAVLERGRARASVIRGRA